MRTPDDAYYVAIGRPHGRDQGSHLHHLTYERAINRPHIAPDGKPIYTHSLPLLGDEYARGRNEIVRSMKAAEAEMGHRFTHLLWLDDDMELPSNILEDLIRHNLPAVSGLYVMRKLPHLPVAYRQATEPGHEDRYWNLSYVPQQVEEVDAVGHGCFLVRRDVYDAVPEPYYAWAEVKRDSQNTFTLVKGTDANGKVIEDRTLGEDMYFCYQVRKAGFRIHLDPTVQCGHEGTHVYTVNTFLQNQHLYHRIAPPGRLAILFLVAPAPKPWDWSTLEREGLGGSETAVAYVARELRRLHHSVTVVSGGAPGEFDGVQYRPHEYVPTLLKQKWDVVVVSRWRDVLPQIPEDNDRIGRVIFWTHDFVEPSRMEIVYAMSNTVVGVSPFHMEMSAHRGRAYTPDIREMIIPNGVDLTLFEGREERVPGRLIWTSNPNRGLPSAVRIFRRLRAKYPHMELHIYGRAAVYGWPADHERVWLPDPDEPGVFVHDPLPKKELARELMKAWAWFYPSTWPETFAIAALEAQAAGTPVLSVPMAALPQTVKGGILKWDFEEMVDELMDEEYWELLSLRGREFARMLDWPKVGQMWNDLLIEEMK